MCVCVCVCVCVRFCVCVCVCVSPFIFLPLFVHVFICPLACLIHLSPGFVQQRPSLFIVVCC